VMNPQLSGLAAELAAGVPRWWLRQEREGGEAMREGMSNDLHHRWMDCAVAEASRPCGRGIPIRSVLVRTGSFSPVS
jgi:hypothetical protein